jgi:O-acetyl-ADP-ribose deacetylase (regulator of RNase III)
MLRFENRDLFDSPAQTLVNPVNTMGVMGAGLALAFRRRFPHAMFDDYARLCRAGSLRVGSLYLWRGASPWVLCFPTKTDWRLPSRIEYLEEGLRAFAATYRELGITSAAFPLLGSGCGGLDPEDVRRLLAAYLGPLPIPVAVHLPPAGGRPVSAQAAAFAAPL